MNTEAYDLLPADIQATLPALYSQENEADPIVRVKYFTPDSFWTWYAVEYDPSNGLFFGLVVGLETELGYFSLEELRQARGPLGLRIERDLYFTPQRLSVLRQEG